MTARQREVLQTAYNGGYVDYPTRGKRS
ncbi:helix-turn-helix domain-containing protein [Halovenus rubra]|uniref:Helix-turn-helix domain-containing protein n=1 Tax=Halovenus rubra TaxID=869890 RepID=A0ACC7E2P6_9EURY